MKIPEGWLENKVPILLHCIPEIMYSLNYSNEAPLNKILITVKV
jgi:hypothetical protein